MVKNAGIDILGGAFKPVSDKTKEQLGLSYGLEVTGVSSGKLQDAGIRRGFIILKVNGESMRTTDDLEQALRTATQSPEQVLFITGMFPSGRRANYAVSLADE